MRAARIPLLTAIVLVLVVALAGCGSSSSKSSNSTTSSAPSAADGASAAHGSGPGQPCHAASVPPAPGKPDVPMPATAPAKLTTKDLKVGTGPVIKANATVTMQYVGVSCSTGTQFDSSWDRGQPFTAQLVAGQLIQGWVEGIPGMRVGGRRVLEIPPNEGYGDQPPPGSGIKPGETLVFVVDALSTK
jgi:peptidylprolyl isomerase